MNIDEIKELIQVFRESGVAELEVQRGENRVRIRRDPAHHEIALPISIQAANSAESPGHPAIAPPVPAFAPAPSTSPAPPHPADNQVLVKSPIVGTFYESPSPGANAFVRVGDSVEPGQVLCIIESMKLMNEIEAEVSGVVAARLVENGRPVEYGEALFAIRLR